MKWYISLPKKIIKGALKKLLLNLIKARINSLGFFVLKNTIVLAATYFPRAQAQVSSALEGLTSEFGKGSGVTPPLKPPEQWRLFIRIVIILDKIFRNKLLKVKVWENQMTY